MDIFGNCTSLAHRKTLLKMYYKLRNKLKSKCVQFVDTPCNIVPFTGLHCVPDPSQLLPLPTPDLVPRAQMQTNTVTGLNPAAVSEMGVCGCGLPGDTAQSAVLDCSGGV